MNQDEIPRETSRGDRAEGFERLRRPISIFVFGAVIIVVQVLDFILGNRVEEIAHAATWVTADILRGLSLGGDFLFLAVLVFGIGHAAHHRLKLAKGEEKGFPPALLLAYLVIATLNVLQNMVILVITPSLQHASQTGLIVDLGLLFASNMLIFSLWYMLADAYLAGGAFDFPPDALRPEDPPRWVDYLALSFNTQATFGPTLEGVRRRPAKVMMMFQTSLSLVVLVVLIARIIKAPV